MSMENVNGGVEKYISKTRIWQSQIKRTCPFSRGSDRPVDKFTRQGQRKPLRRLYGFRRCASHLYQERQETKRNTGLKMR